MSETQSLKNSRIYIDGAVRQELRLEARHDRHGAHLQHCRIGALENYDPELDARADELEALRCLAYLLRHDLKQPEKVYEYLDQVDSVLDRMVEELKKSA